MPFFRPPPSSPTHPRPVYSHVAAEASTQMFRYSRRRRRAGGGPSIISAWATQISRQVVVFSRKYVRSQVAVFSRKYVHSQTLFSRKCFHPQVTVFSRKCFCSKVAVFSRKHVLSYVAVFFQTTAFVLISNNLYHPPSIMNYLCFYVQ